MAIMKVSNSLKNEVKKIMDNGDPAHDYEHVMRVCQNAEKICKKEKKADKRLVLSAALLHDIASYPKSDRRSKQSSVQSAKKSKILLRKFSFTESEIITITDAIRDHSFSRSRIPKTLEGKILQDADRLDAIGAIGIARAFSTGGSLKRPLYNTDDPFCKYRSPDDKTWTLDHFFQKLLGLESLMNTRSGKLEAKRRTRILKEYLKMLKLEIHP